MTQNSNDQLTTMMSHHGYKKEHNKNYPKQALRLAKHNNVVK